MQWFFAGVKTLTPLILLRLLLEYAGIFLLSILLSVLRSGRHQRGGRVPSLLSMLTAGPKEELVFRGLPVGLAITLGLPHAPFVWAGTAVWAGYHAITHESLSSLVFLVLFGLFLSQFWYQGFHGLWWLAVVFHSGHNLLVWLIAHVHQRESGLTTPTSSSSSSGSR